MLEKADSGGKKNIEVVHHSTVICCSYVTYEQSQSPHPLHPRGIRGSSHFNETGQFFTCIMLWESCKLFPLLEHLHIERQGPVRWRPLLFLDEAVYGNQQQCLEGSARNYYVCFLAYQIRSLPYMFKSVIQSAETTSWLVFRLESLILTAFSCCALRKRFHTLGQLFLIIAFLLGCLHHPTLHCSHRCTCHHPLSYPLPQSLWPPSLPGLLLSPLLSLITGAGPSDIWSEREGCLQQTTSHLTFIGHHSGLV